MEVKNITDVNSKQQPLRNKTQTAVINMESKVHLIDVWFARHTSSELTVWNRSNN